MTARKKIGIVTPCYNEEETVDECHATVKALFAGPLSDYDYEHLFAITVLRMLRLSDCASLPVPMPMCG